MEIRIATETDLPAIGGFDEMGGDRGAEVDAGCCSVAMIAGCVVGYASYAPQGLLGQPLLTFLCVHPDFRRRGIAVALVQHVRSMARGRKLIASTEDWCGASQRLFGKLGWRKIGQLEGINADGSAEWFYSVDLDRQA